MTDPSNNFHTGGGPCTLPSLGCLPIIGIGLFSLFAGFGFGAFVIVMAARIFGGQG